MLLSKAETLTCPEQKQPMTELVSMELIRSVQVTAVSEQGGNLYALEVDLEEAVRGRFFSHFPYPQIMST